MGLNIELLESSFAAIAPRGEELTNLFYKNLFADYPAVAPLFTKANMKEQKKKLLAALKLTVDNLRKPEVLVPALENLGAGHLEYGVTEDHYPAVGATLIKSLAEIAGDLWNQDLEQAWGEAYGEVARHMLAGASAAVVA